MTDAIEPKPAHLGLAHGSQFQDANVVDAYRHRPPYPAETFAILAALLGDGPRVVLDAGCGTGDLALGLLQHVPGIERVDAVDLSPAMIAAGRARPGGDDPRLRWIVGGMETAPLDPPYGLVAAGESLHWMEWAVVLPCFRGALVPGGVLAIVSRRHLPAPWDAGLAELIPHFTTNREFQPYDLVDELQSRGLFQLLGQRSTRPVRIRQPVEAFIELMHSRNGFSRARMAPERAAEFDRRFATLLREAGCVEDVTYDVAGVVQWGLP
jgi:SAM-dependent methyltransferase